MTDELIWFRVVQYLEDNRAQSPYSFTLSKQSDESTIITAWGYTDIDQPDIDKLMRQATRDGVAIRENMRFVRQNRNKLLSATDYLFLNYSELKDTGRIVEMIEFRQRLRDLPATLSTGNPVSRRFCIAMFPKPPEFIAPALQREFPDVMSGDDANKKQKF